MGLSRRARSIVVGSDQYRWLAVERDTWVEGAGGGWDRALERRHINLVVQHPTGRGQKLLAQVPVYRAPIDAEDDGLYVPVKPRVTRLRTPKQESAVSPALVRRVIEHALRMGWTPTASGGEFLVPAAVVKNLL